MSELSVPRACPLCALVQAVPPLASGEFACCARCGARVADPRTAGARNARARQAVCAALVLYPLAVTLPILRIERLGHAEESSVLGGSLDLLAQGKLALGALLFLCSVVVPLVKLVTLLVLLLRPRVLAARQRTHAWRALELSGRFGMLDVLLVAILVAWIELGSWVEVEPGPAALSFAACVLCSLLASAWFDPHTLWRDADEGAGA